MSKKDFKIARTVSLNIDTMQELETIAVEKKVTINKLIQDILVIYIAGQKNKKKQKGI